MNRIKRIVKGLHLNRGIGLVEVEAADFVEDGGVEPGGDVVACGDGRADGGGADGIEGGGGEEGWVRG